MKKITRNVCNSDLQNVLQTLTYRLKLRIGFYKNNNFSSNEDKVNFLDNKIKKFISDEWRKLSNKFNIDDNGTDYIIPKEEIQKELLDMINKDSPFCIYCELSKNGDLHIDHIKPKQTEEFFEFAFDWNNFLPTCIHCNRNKSTRYNPLLYLNPSDNNYKDFDFHFRYAINSDNQPFPKIIGKTDEGKYMEDLLGLNKNGINEHNVYGVREEILQEAIIKNTETDKERVKKNIKMCARGSCESFVEWLTSDDPKSPLNNGYINYETTKNL